MESLLEPFPLSQFCNVAVLGSTGSIGKATLDVIAFSDGRFRVTGIACGTQVALLEQQISAFSPQFAIASNASDPAVLAWHHSSERTDSVLRQIGMDSVVSLAQSNEVDIVVAAIVGVAGLESSLAAAASGKRLALANKESLVVAGSLLMETAKKNSAEILPVDSEHSAIFQCLQAGQSRSAVKRVVLTASGGSLRNWPVEKLSAASVEDALSHPTWQMGRKITVDSATMMNKALEVIEAKWLFGLEPHQISVVVHPQSVIHSMVEFCDGSVVGQMSPPDMRLAIQYSLTYPERVLAPSPYMDWNEPMQLDWKPADLERYPALELGFEVAAKGGTCGSVLNAANEAAVELFLDRKIKLTDIAIVCREVLHHHSFSPSPTLTELLALDRWSRNEVQRWINAKC